MSNCDLSAGKPFEPFFQLRAHTYQKTLHGRLFEFERPIFATDVLGAKAKTGLFIAVRDNSNLDAYVFIDQETLKFMMDEDIPSDDRIIDFATRNKSMMTKLVLDLNNTSRQQKDNFMTTIENSEVTTLEGRTVRIYRFPTVEYDNYLRLMP